MSTDENGGSDGKKDHSVANALPGQQPGFGQTIIMPKLGHDDDKPTAAANRASIATSNSLLCRKCGESLWVCFCLRKWRSLAVVLPVTARTYPPRAIFKIKKSRSPMFSDGSYTPD